MRLIEKVTAEVDEVINGEGNKVVLKEGINIVLGGLI